MSTTSQAIPAHIAIIMDGNGRWAKTRSLLRHAGHKAGLDAAREVIECCAERGVGALTLFTFSSENWRRPENEVSRLMELFLGALGKDVRDLHKNGIRVRFIGKRSAFSNKLQEGMAEGEALTAGNRRMLLNVAVGYGGRWDITEAARKFAAEVAAGTADASDLNEHRLAVALSLGEGPDPDLFIRTGGERRISNFLLWNLAYTELYFTDTLWPDFRKAALDEALEWFAARQRRFGMIPEQVDEDADA
ncbi:MAG TPA: polyprenyl diphosphate synthase [Gammaproteobacteria bacterium]|nr:polyprenyl diphosphate synthase [Gammaproteobacteria bacterium]